jgi:transcriptional regulator with XRE-family HTH domain
MSNQKGDPEQRATRAWLYWVMDSTGLSASGLAHKAGVAVSTITRFLNKDVKHTLSARTIARIAAVTEPEPSPLVAAALTPTDVEILRRALKEARLVMRRDVPPEEHESTEAQIVAHIYDVLRDAALNGRSVEDAARTLRSSLRMQARAWRK